jgi:hypothetical protein
VWTQLPSNTILPAATAAHYSSAFLWVAVRP